MTYVQIILNGLFLAGLYLLLAQGLNLVFGVMGIVNLAHGAFAVIGGLSVFTMWGAGVNPFLALGLVMVAAAVLGALAQLLVIEHIGSHGHERQLLTLLATFGLSYMLVNAADRVWGPEYRTLPYLQSAVTLGPLRFPASLLVGVVVAAAMTLALSLWLARTRTGKGLRATSQNSVGSGACGIDARRFRVLGFALGASLAAAAGVLLVLVQPIAPQAATQYTIVAFVVVALGGLGNYAGAALGAALLGVVQTLGAYELGSVFQASAPYVLLIVIMLFCPNGLLPARAR